MAIWLFHGVWLLRIGSISVHGGWEGLLGLWVSPGFGILFYFPVVILLPFALKSMINNKENRNIVFLVFYIIIVNWLFVGKLSDDEPVSWSGAFAWGPRYIIPLLPFIVLSSGTANPFKERRFVPGETISDNNFVHYWIGCNCWKTCLGLLCCQLYMGKVGITETCH